MNTHDIELPPLPFGHPTYEFPDGAYDSEQMHQYARAAIEADRKRRGENQQPFGYFRALPFGWTDCAETDEGAIALYDRPQVYGEPVYLYRRKGLDDFVTCDKARYGELSDKPDHFETRVLYTAPQPAEPLSRSIR